MKKHTALAALFLLAACSGGSPGKASFEKAINRYAAQQGVCLPIKLEIENPRAFGTPLFGAVVGEPVVKIASRTPGGEEINAAALEQMRLLDNEGFYKKANVESRPAANGRGDFKISVYELTEKGRARTRDLPHGKSFCVGVLKVEKINWYTEPAAADGLTISKVSYQARMETEAWAGKLLQQNGNPLLPKQAVRTQTATLVKTNDGWHDIRELHP